MKYSRENSQCSIFLLWLCYLTLKDCIPVSCYKELVSLSSCKYVHLVHNVQGYKLYIPMSLTARSNEMEESSDVPETWKCSVALRFKSHLACILSFVKLLCVFGITVDILCVGSELQHDQVSEHYELSFKL